jgi:hypothetical protein
MTGRSTGYFHFPLCLLAFRKDYKDRLQHIVSYCLCEHAQRLIRTSANVPWDTALDAAAKFLKVNIGSAEATTNRWKAASRFVCQWQNRYGRDASVRIATALLWEAHDNTGLTYREFSILCAINSVIGKRRSVPRRITEPSIRVRAAGFKSSEVATRERARDKLGTAQLLTPHQVRYTLENLHQRQFFARARVGAKTVKYMVGVSDDALRASLLQTETYRPRFKAERAQKDRELMAAIKLIKHQGISVGKDQSTGVSVPTESHHDNNKIPDMLPDINICALNNSSFKISPQNTGAKNMAPSAEGGFINSLTKKKLDRSEFSAEELAFIDLYHQICLPTSLGFLPITMRSEELDKVLETFATGFDRDEWSKNFHDAVEYRRKIFVTNPRQYNTLVQVCWKLMY